MRGTQTKNDAGFTIRRDIEDGQAVAEVQITDLGRLNLRKLGRALIPLLNGGFRVVTLSFKSRNGVLSKTIPIRQLQTEVSQQIDMKRQFMLEKLIRDGV